MAEVRRVVDLKIMGNFNFDEIQSFKTERGWIGMYDCRSGHFVMMPDADNEMFLITIRDTDTLLELDEEVYRLTDNHISEVFSTGKYRIELEV